MRLSLPGLEQSSRGSSALLTEPEAVVPYLLMHTPRAATAAAAAGAATAQTTATAAATPQQPQQQQQQQSAIDRPTPIIIRRGSGQLVTPLGTPVAQSQQQHVDPVFAMQLAVRSPVAAAALSATGSAARAPANETAPPAETERAPSSSSWLGTTIAGAMPRAATVREFAAQLEAYLARFDPLQVGTIASLAPAYRQRQRELWAFLAERYEEEDEGARRGGTASARRQLAQVSAQQRAARMPPALAATAAAPQSQTTAAVAPHPSHTPIVIRRASGGGGGGGAGPTPPTQELVRSDATPDAGSQQLAPSRGAAAAAAAPTGRTPPVQELVGSNERAPSLVEDLALKEIVRLLQDQGTSPTVVRRRE